MDPFFLIFATIAVINVGFVFCMCHILWVGYKYARSGIVVPPDLLVERDGPLKV